jgi:hypothetical protein
MDVRLARPTDVPLLISLALDESAHLVSAPVWPANHALVRSLARAIFPLALPGRLWVCHDGSSSGLLEVQPRRYVIGCDITRLAVQGDAEAVIGPSLQAAVDYLRARGVPRLFARATEEAGTLLQEYDFQRLAREYVLLGPTTFSTGESDLPSDSRYRIPPDAWPLHQLETSLTPPLIRQLEGLSSVDWSTTLKDMSEIVVERDGKLVAWVGWGARCGSHLININLLVDADHREIGPDLIRHVLKQIKPGHRLVARVRDYQVEITRAFTDSGFEVVSEEVLLLKHAGVELARAQSRRLNVAAVPSVPGFNLKLCPESNLPDRITHEILDRKKTHCDATA